MGVAIPWLVLMSFEAYQHGYKQQKWPEPYYFIGGSAAMSIAGVIAMANPKVGALFAWALLLGTFVGAYAKVGGLAVPAASSEKLPGA